MFQKSRPKADSPNSWTLTADSKALRQGKNGEPKLPKVKLQRRCSLK